MSSRTHVATLLNTLAHERHAREALLVAFADELRAAIPERAPESTRTLAALARAERGEMDETGFAELLQDLRTIVHETA